MSLDADTAEYFCKLIADKKRSLTSDLAKGGFDSYCHDPLFEKLLHDTTLTYVINNNPGGQQLFVPQVVHRLIEDLTSPMHFRKDPEEIILAYLKQQTTEPILEAYGTSDPKVTPLEGELKRFGMVLVWKERQCILPRDIQITPELIDRYCQEFQLSPLCRRDLYLERGITPNFTWSH